VRPLALETAYPGIAFRARTRNWWARLTRVPPECEHLETEYAWMATFAPDTLYLRGRARALREPARPEVSLCRACLLRLLEPELAAYGGRVVTFEPNPESFSQYFFVSANDFEAAGLRPEVAAVIARRLAEDWGGCAECSRRATWLWIARSEVANLDEYNLIRAAPGGPLCAGHGATALCRAFTEISEANLFYVNAPYGGAGPTAVGAGAYLWI
jgi:hypothetical protein